MTWSRDNIITLFVGSSWSIIKVDGSEIKHGSSNF